MANNNWNVYSRCSVPLAAVPLSAEVAPPQYPDNGICVSLESSEEISSKTFSDDSKLTRVRFKEGYDYEDDGRISFLQRKDVE